MEDTIENDVPEIQMIRSITDYFKFDRNITHIKVRGILYYNFLDKKYKNDILYRYIYDYIFTENEVLHDYINTATDLIKHNGTIYVNKNIICCVFAMRYTFPIKYEEDVIVVNRYEYSQLLYDYNLYKDLTEKFGRALVYKYIW